MKKTVLLFCAAILFAVCAPVPVHAYTGYENYNYSNRDRSYMPAPDAYLPEYVIYASTAGTFHFEAPEDVFVCPDGRIMVLDSGNGRIVVLSSDYTFEKELTAEFEGVSVIHKAKGLFVDPDGLIYVADTENQRIAVLNSDGSVKVVHSAPQSSILPEDFIFKPVKITVDSEGIIYIVSEGTFEGIITMDSEGRFNGFIGANPVKTNPWDVFWKRIATRTQRDAMLQFIPTDHSGIAIGDDNFIYCTTRTNEDGKKVKLLNPGGVDIIRTDIDSSVKLTGDPEYYWFGDLKGTTVFIDVAYFSNGMYACLDSTRGKIFVYNEDGYMLYTFGALGNSDGTFRQPTSLSYQGDKVIVLDKERASLTVFAPTPYATLLHEAIALQRSLEFELAAEKWKLALLENQNFEPAHTAIGKIALNTGDNKQAMKSFKLGSNKQLYSQAMNAYRTDWIYNNIPVVLSVIIFLLLFWCAIKIIKKIRSGKKLFTLPELLKWPLYTMIHPFNGFWGIKAEKKGRLTLSFGIIGLLLLTLLLRIYGTGYLFSSIAISEFSFVQMTLIVIGVYFLFCVANWSLTTLMEGEGKFKEILMTTAYAVMPIVLVNIPLMLLSNILTLNEMPFFVFFNVLSIVWSAALLLVGCLTIHNYTMGKTIAVSVLTVGIMVAMAVLCILFFNLLQQVYIFILSVFREIQFRM